MKKVIFFALTAALISGCKKYGCTDDTAANYSNVANADDGSCFFYQPEVEMQQNSFDVNCADWTDFGDDLYYTNFSILNDVSSDDLVQVYFQYAVSDESYYALPYETEYYNLDVSVSDNSVVGITTQFYTSTYDMCTFESFKPATFKILVVKDFNKMDVTEQETVQAQIDKEYAM